MAYTRDDLLRDFRTYLEKMYKVVEDKNNDYTTFDNPLKNLNRLGAIGIVARMGDKLNRIENCAMGKEMKITEETLDNDCIDEANYSLLLLCYMRSKRS